MSILLHGVNRIFQLIHIAWFSFAAGSFHRRGAAGRTAVQSDDGSETVGPYNEKRPLAGAFFLNLERETRLELATSTLARLRSTN